MRVRAGRFVALTAICLVVAAAAMPGQAAPVRGAQVRQCSRPCIVKISGFGNMKWPSNRSDLRFSAPRTFRVTYSFQRCSRSGNRFVLILHNRSITLSLVRRRAAAGRGSKTVSGSAALTWQPQVKSRCPWKFSVRGTVTPPPTPTATPTATATATTPDFALSAADFPPDSTVQKSGTESNEAIDAGDTLFVHFGDASFPEEGRITGYYMQAEQENNGHPVLTYYLVSQFPSPAQAAAAFSQQKAGWDALVQAHPDQFSSADPPQVGEQRALYLSTANVSGQTVDTSELLFTRGVYLVEVGQAFNLSDFSPYGAADIPFQLSIAAKLDVIARG